MALTGTSRGQGTHNTSSGTLTLSPSGNFAAGSMGVLVVAADNTGGGGAHNISQVTDSIGNTWTIRRSPLYDPGAAAAGVQGIIATTPQDVGVLQTSTVITVTFGNNTTAKAWALHEVIGSVGVPTYVTGAENTGSATASPTVTTSSITSGHMVIGGLFNEQGTGQTVTQDGDSTNGTWSAQQTAEVGTTAAGMTVSTQRKIVTATATQTYNPTLGVSSDVILSWIQIQEVIPPKNAHGQAQAQIKQTYVAHAQAQGSIPAPYTEYYNGRDAGGEVNPTLDITGVNWGVGDLLLVFTTGRDESTIFSSVTDNGPGETFNVVESFITVQGVLWGGIAWAKAEGTGSNTTVTIHTTEDNYVASGGLQGVVLVIPNADFEDHSTAETGAVDTDAPSIDHTTIATETKVFYLINPRNRVLTIDSGDGLTEIRAGTQAGASGAISAVWLYYKEETSAGTKNASGTLSSALDWLAMAVSVTEASGVTTRRAHAQAQATIKQVYNQHAQSQADIKQTYTDKTGQAQAQIKQVYQVHGQAQAWIENTYTGHGQAQSDIKQIYRVHAQSQAQIKQTYPLCSGYAGKIVSDSPVGYWRLGESSGINAVDQTGRSNGTYANNPTLGVTGAVSGDTAVTFNGTNQWVTVPDVTAQRVGNVFTLEAWINTTDSDGIILYGRSVGGYTFSIASNFLIAARDNVGTIVTSTVTVTDGQWHHVVWTRTGVAGQDKLYIDKIDRTGTVTDQGSIANSAGIAISSATFGAHLAASIDEPAVYNYALSESQISAHYDIGTGASTYCIGLFGQAQADIKQTYRSHGQARALISGSSVVHGQAQAAIKSVGRGLGQAQARIMKLVTFDNFNRNVADGWGVTSDGTFGWLEKIITPPSQIDVNGTEGTINPDAVVAIHNYPLLHIGMVQFDVYVPTDRTEFASYDFDTKIEHLYVVRSGSDLQIGNAFDFIDIPASAATWYTFKATFHITEGQPTYFKLWERGTVEPNWQLTSQAEDASSGFGSGGANLRISNNKSTPTEVARIDNFHLWSFIEPIEFLRFGTAAATIEQTYTQSAQAQAWIEQTYTQSAQAQAWIEQTYNKHGQAQAQIINIYQSYAQAQALISGFVQVRDSFTRNETDQWGTADLGGAWSKVGFISDSSFNVDGSVGNIVVGTVTTEYNQRLTSVATDTNILLRIKTDRAVTAEQQILIFGRYAGSTHYRVVVIFASNNDVRLRLDNSNGGIAGPTTIAGLTHAANRWFWVRFKVEDSDIRARIWQEGTIEPTSWDINTTDTAIRGEGTVGVGSWVQTGESLPVVVSVDNINIPMYQAFGQAQAQIKQIYNAYAQAQADIKQTYFGLGQAQATIRGNAFGQAQAQIKQTYVAHGQAQADIEQTYSQHGQAQSSIKQTYFALGQAQGQIKQTYTQHGQANADIKATDNKHGQAQAQIKQTYVQHAQSQADIKQTYFVHAQANAWIEQTYFGLGQAQAQIKTTYYAHGQANADILQTYTDATGQTQAWIKTFGNNVHGQSQAWVETTYFQHGQAQGKINAFGVNAHGQAQGNVKAEGNFGHGQAQARLLAFDFNQYGQAQGTVEQTYNQHAQAQADIEQTYNQHGQTQGAIKTTYYQHGQTQADILQTYVVHGQSEAWIENTYNGLGQAQALIKNTYFGLGQANAKINAFGVNQHGQAQGYILSGTTEHGQAQAYIKAIDVNAHGQAQGTIETTYNSHGQAQGDIKQTYYVHGQANAAIANTYFASGQAQGHIENTYSQHGQANADIEQIYNQHAQAQAQIKQTYFVHGQANAYIILIQQGYGQAQGTIETTYNVHGQSQANIEQTYTNSGNAQGYITANINVYAQSQGQIKQTYIVSGQCQAYIISGNFAYAQAQAYIIRIDINAYGQAEAFISKLAGYGQANALIRQDKVIHKFSISDRPSVQLKLSDRLKTKAINTDREQPSLTPSDTKKVTLSLSDNLNITLNLDDRPN